MHSQQFCRIMHSYESQAERVGDETIVSQPLRPFVLHRGHYAESVRRAFTCSTCQFHSYLFHFFVSGIKLSVFLFAFSKSQDLLPTVEPTLHAR